MRMYDLTDAYVSLLALYDDAESEEERERIMAQLLAVGDDIADKAENYARLAKNKEAEAAAYDAEIKRLTAKKKAAENVVTRTKENLLFAMEVAGAKEISTSIGKWRVQANPLSVNVLDESKVPERFLIAQAPKIDRRAIIAEFKETGELMDGIVIEQNMSVRFR